jgi:hypothetical protein
MATTTPNYGWTVPTSTDLVKDGATAIETLGDAIDASMNTALGTKKAGMVLLNTTSFSAVSSVSLAQDTFTSTYDNYKIYVDISAVSGTNEFRIRGRTAGSDNSTANYNHQLIDIIGTGSAISKTAATGGTSSYFGYFDNPAMIMIDVYKPKLATPTVWQIYSNLYYTIASAGIQLTRGNFSASTAFDSMTMISNAGTFTGSYSVYGVNK